MLIIKLKNEFSAPSNLYFFQDLQAINVGNHNDLVDMRIVIDEVVK